MHACAIASRGDLPEARALAASFRRHHPDGTLTVLLVDDGPPVARADLGLDQADVVLLDEIGIDEQHLSELTAAHDVEDLRRLARPLLLRHVLALGHGHAVLVGVDTWFVRRLTELPALLAAHPVLLVPWFTDPSPPTPPRPGERRPQGVFDTGFTAVADTADGRRFLQWWAAGSVLDPRAPGPLDAAPGVVDHLVVRDPGWGAGWWNLAGRPVVRTDGVVTAGGSPLAFVHLGGRTPDAPWVLSRDQGSHPEVLLSTSATLREVVAERDLHARPDPVHDSPAPDPRPGARRGEVVLTPLVRQLVREDLLLQPRDAQRPSIATGDELAAWLASAEPGRSIGRLGRLLTALLHERPDLREAYPEAMSGDVGRFLEWARLHGVPEGAVPRATVEAEERRHAETGATTFVSGPEVPVPGRRRTHGVEALGYFTAELGIGEAARQLVHALEAAQVPVSTSTYTRTTSRRSAAWTDRRATEGERHDTLLLCVNADHTAEALDDVRPGYTRGRHRIGLWFWELDDLPASMRGALDLVDEVWVASEFNAATLRRITDRPVTVVRFPVHVPAASDVRIPEVADPAPYTFLFVFDHLSVTERKNPWGLVEAFVRAFPEPGAARLVVKSVNGERRPLDRERLRHVAAGRDDVVLVERYLDRSELDGLVRAADCYVSLHRSEGFGQTMAEAMAIGMPVIATGYSGNLAFMGDGDLLVRHTMVPVPPGCDPYPTTSLWAEPDLDHAAELMRQVCADPGAARERARLAAARITAEFSPAAAGAVLRARLEQVWAERDDARRLARRDRAEGPRA